MGFLWSNEEVALLFAVADHCRGFGLSEHEFCREAAAIVSRKYKTRSARSIQGKMRLLGNPSELMEQGTKHKSVKDYISMIDTATAVVREYFSTSPTITASNRSRANKEKDVAPLQHQGNHSKRKRSSSHSVGQRVPRIRSQEGVKDTDNAINRPSKSRSSPRRSAKSLSMSTSSSPLQSRCAEVGQSSSDTSHMNERSTNGSTQLSLSERTTSTPGLNIEALHQSLVTKNAATDDSEMEMNSSPSQALLQHPESEPSSSSKAVRVELTTRNTAKEATLVEHISYLTSLLGPTNLRAGTATSTSDPLARELGVMWDTIGDDLKYFSCNLSRENVQFFASTNVVSRQASNNQMMIHNAQDLQVTSSMRLRQVVISEICSKVFGQQRVCIDPQQWEHSDEVWQALSILSGDLTTIRTLANTVQRLSRDRLKRDRIPELSRNIATSIHEKLTVLSGKQTYNLIDSTIHEKRQKRIENWVTRAFDLRIGLELSTKQYRFVMFKPGTLFDAKWMRPETADGSDDYTDSSVLATSRVSETVFPALIQLPEEVLGSVVGSSSWKKAMPTNKQFGNLWDEQYPDQKEWECCVEAVVTLNYSTDQTE